MSLEIEVGSIKGKLNGIHCTLNLGARDDNPIPINIPGDKASEILGETKLKDFTECLQIITNYYLTTENEGLSEI